ncbi:MAG TPA: DUF1800 domain-containing protein [Kiritimatiellia bacterium]|nr:DUF1800 domain-containing protein [Kiritimatiellia bacterium]HMP33952.1 DUF1800 domain-containing protein [Kiritimatiellia bacterium]
MALDGLPQERWTPEMAAHLLNRAGFGGTPAEVEALYQRGHAGAVDWLLDIPPGDGVAAPPVWANPFTARRDELLGPMPMRGSDRDADRQARQRVVRQREESWLFDLRAWWLYRMRHTTTPLQEKMTLFFHGHFATGYEKVRSAYAMFLQNQTFRRHATGNWRALVEAVTRDPAMLIYLDGIENAKGAPNENYAREVMELFTLGEGHYTEADIREAARAFTGWRFNRRLFTMEFVPSRHDAGRKSFMGKKGAFTAEDIVGLILEQPQAARWLAAKLWTYFAYENPEPAVVDALAATLRRADYDLAPALRAVFMSRAFYGTRAFRTQVKSPVQWMIGTLRMLDAPMPETLQVQRTLASLGQQLFDPPNVKGWDGGITWITTASLALRYEAGARFAHQRGQARARDRMLDHRETILAEARALDLDIVLPSTDTPWLREASGPALDWARLLPDEVRHSKRAALDNLLWRLYQTGLRERERALFAAYLDQLPDTARWTESTCGDALAALINTPAFQLT